jgi:hypothetical protein
MALALGASWGIAFLVSAGITYEIIAKDVSSPQTAEINIKKRADTLMKWVHVGQVESAVFITIAATVDKKYRQPILVGGIFAMIITEIEYIYAKRSGLAKPDEPGTEDYGGNSNGGSVYGNMAGVSY